jgi:N utilization substance protein B
MANRHLSRSVVLQTLFEWDFCTKSPQSAEDALTRNAEEFAPGVDDDTFMRKLLRDVLLKQPDLDLIITRAAPDWPLDKIATVDRNVLRIGLCELLFSDKKEVPAKVAINEAIELAKSFGGETSGRFVNGVLGAVYKEMGEPGKDDIAPKKKRKADVPFEEMEIDRLGGAVVYARNGGDIYVGLVHDVFGHWTLSKSKIREDETVEQGVVRAIKEEMGLDVTVGESVGDNEYVANHPERGKYRKQVKYYLAEAPYVPITLGESGGLDDAKWFPLKEIATLNFYNDIVPIVTTAIQKLMIGASSEAGK